MVILSCGHVATDNDGDGFGIPIKVADQARDGSPAISYLSVCEKCSEWYEEEGLIVDDEEAFFKEAENDR